MIDSSESQKTAAFLMAANGLTAHDISVALGIDEAQVRQWLRRTDNDDEPPPRAA